MELCLRCEDQSCSHLDPKGTSLLLYLHPGECWGDEVKTVVRGLKYGPSYLGCQ